MVAQPLTGCEEKVKEEEKEKDQIVYLQDGLEQPSATWFI